VRGGVWEEGEGGGERALYRSQNSSVFLFEPAVLAQHHDQIETIHVLELCEGQLSSEWLDHYAYRHWWAVGERWRGSEDGGE
jgi:hypothetical protein